MNYDLYDHGDEWFGFHDHVDRFHDDESYILDDMII